MARDATDGLVTSSARERGRAGELLPAARDEQVDPSRVVGARIGAAA